MKDIETLKKHLSELAFDNYSSYIKGLLSLFDISATTIARLLNKGAESNFNEPLYLYRRAVFLCNITDVVESKSTTQYSKTFPLVISLYSDHIEIENIDNEKVICNYDKLHQYILLLKPLFIGKKQEKDIYESLDLASLIAQLKNKLTSNNCANVKEIILNILTISFVHYYVKDHDFQNILDWHKGNKTTGIMSDLKFIISKNGYGRLLRNLDYMQLDKFNPDCEKLIQNIFSFDLSYVDTEILGSLIYKILDEKEEASLFGHQTSFQNINKMLCPLFYDSFLSNIQTNKENTSELIKLSNKIRDIRFFDPTNSPGCFLSSALTHIITLNQTIEEYLHKKLPPIKIQNFIGLVNNKITQQLSHLILFFSYCEYLSDYSNHDIHTVENAFNDVTIRIGNQLETNWNEICPNNGSVYIIGSPTFKGVKNMTRNMKSEMQLIFQSQQFNEADYSSAWLIKASYYIKCSTSKASFVLTNSICQGEQVASIWENVFKNNCRIEFAYQSFKWQNSSKENVGVSVVIIGICSAQEIINCQLFSKEYCYKCSEIGPYLIPNNSTIVKKRTRLLSPILPKMRKGNMPYDNGHLILSKSDRDELLDNHPASHMFIKRFVGSDEFIKGIPRYCLWIPDKFLSESLSFSLIAERINKVEQFRKSSTASQKTKDNPHQFREFFETSQHSQTLVIPSVSSENRDIIPIGFVYNNTIVSNLAFTIYDCEPWVLSVLVSNMHQLWVKTVCGKLESRHRYSNQLGYNTFPFPEITSLQKQNLSNLALDLIRIREDYCQYSLGKLYSSMPPKLKSQHQFIDEYVESCYRIQPFINENEKLFFLLDMYSKLQ